jgi:RNA polymerase sigma-70 factor
MPFSETDLVLMMKNDSQEAFFIFYRKYLPVVDDFAYSLVKDREVSKEISQNVFVKVWDRRKKLENVESLRSYLFKMTRNAVYDYFHTYRSRTVSLDDMAEAVDLSDLMVEEDRSDSDLDFKNMFMKMLIEMDRLPEKSRKIFVMSKMLGMKNKEIAESLSCSVKTIEYHISNALSFLRKNINF